MKGREDPFKGGAEHIVAAAETESSFNLAFRCTSAGDLTVMAVMSEKNTTQGSQLTRLMNLADPKMHAIIDDQPRRTLGAEVDLTIEKAIRFNVSDAEAIKLTNDILRAKKRVAIAAEVNGQIVYSHAFGLVGMRRALQPMIDGCRLAADAPVSPAAPGGLTPRRP